MDDAAARVRSAVAGGDRAGLRLLLHPYVRWTLVDGSVARGRNAVLAMLEDGVPDPPAEVELRDGQVYRWRA